MTFEVTVVKIGGEPIPMALVTANDEASGLTFSRGTDGNGYANVALFHVPDGTPITLSVVAGGYQNAILYTTTGPENQTIRVVLDSFKRPPSPLVPRGPLPPFPTPYTFDQLPWDPPQTRDYLRADFWGVELPGAPWVPGASYSHYERILSWFIDRYPKDFQIRYLETYAGYRYTHLLRSYADSCGPVNMPSTAPPGNGQTLEQFVESCLFCKQFVPYVHVRIGSKYFQPANMSAQQWADFSDPIIDALIAAKAMDECSLGWEWNLWNTPGKTSTDAFIHAADKCHAAGVSFWQHMSPHYTSWQANDDTRGRFGWFDDLAGHLDGLNYQSLGAGWSPEMLQARIVDSLWLFGQRGNDVKFRMEEDFANFMFDNDVVRANVDEHRDASGNPIMVDVDVTPEQSNCRGYLSACTVDNVKHTDAKVYGYGNGGRRPDGSPL